MTTDAPACHITGNPTVCKTHDVLATDWTTADDGPTATADTPTCPLAGEPVGEADDTLADLARRHTGQWIGRNP